MTKPRVIIIGAGIGGLATAIRMAALGASVEVLEKNDYPGGKISSSYQGNYRFDQGPSLFTMPEWMDELFIISGKSPKAYYSYERLSIIAKYFFSDRTVIHVFQAPEAFAEEIAEKTRVPVEQVLGFLKKSKNLYELTAHVFLERSLHRPDVYFRAKTIRSLLQLHKLDAFKTMHQANSARFDDPRVVQLFDRFATYNGSDPYQAPATLNIIPHLEHELGAFYPQGGMQVLPQSLYKLGLEMGVSFKFGQTVDEILVEHKKVQGIRIENQVLPADIVVSNMDIVPTYRRLLPNIPAPEKILTQPRSSSALIFFWGIRKSFPQLELHNVFFSGNYREEFESIWKNKRIYQDPTVYLYISSLLNPADAPEGCQNWFVMINVPSDEGQDWDELILKARKDILNKLSLALDENIEALIESEEYLDPRKIQLNTLSHQGALYGNSSNNKFAAFLRHANFSTKINGLYFVGGSVHPGGGIPLCLQSAKITSELIRKDWKLPHLSV